MSSASALPAFDLTEQDVAELAVGLVEYHKEFSGLFSRREQFGWCSKYLTGLVLPGLRKSVETIALHVADTTVRELQRFIGVGAWDDDVILHRHAELVSESLGSSNGVLIVDGSDFPKQGRHSVGVMRQYCGASGKIANCQAGVFLAYASDRGHTLLDRRLYMPHEWLSEAWQGLREACDVPEGIEFRTKPQLAWEMIEQVQSQGCLPFAWVTCDEGFGGNPEFLKRLEGARINYLAEVPVSTRVWLTRPVTEIPAAKGRGRPSSRERLAPGTPPPQRVDEIAVQLPPTAWHLRKIKEGEKGVLNAQFAFVRAVAVRDEMPGPDVCVVLRRNCQEPNELKVFVTNAPVRTPQQEFIRVSGMRWPIETCFRQAKGALGMDQYQTRSWRGWLHHMTMVILAHHFLVRLQLQHKKGHRR
jgi:SRSO17 transposase